MKRSSIQIGFLLPAALMLAAALLALSACQKVPEATEQGAEGKEISLQPALETQSKVTSYSTANITGVDLRIYAYLHGETTAFINGDRYHYVPEYTNWRFYQGASIVHHYWPIVNSVWNSTTMTGRLDFVGYAPYDLSNTGVTLNDYAAGNPRFSVSMPAYASYASQEEFIYAYVDDQTKDSGSGTVPMTFNHPFASVYFALGVAPRGTVINSITLENIYQSGSFSHTASPQWTRSGDVGNYSVTGINKTIPNQLNYGQTIGGPYYVLPQVLDHETASVNDVAIKVHYTDAGGVEHDASGVIGIITSVQQSWLPGTAYTYSISIGERSDDGILNVTVTSWIIEGASTSDID